ncbi:leucine--tRNA ligase [Flavobacterium sp. NKUCC04_CG]|uniref:leucine--tRNA ligase n=1 Tax=Flavobacterium sp. NKUCC04_CG TaxID=2842121 RepID=UPI001C5B62DA|nr:leucine--tRNA ligase [Flavobacterium sp. NKUCC04_CG]MBW3518244.1 leucine--tRNA ligase [Flavobacterium sp. NKUCC04_CG]
MKYIPNEIEAKWQRYWSENQTFKTEAVSDKPKYFVLDMFPYPSGAGLHVGHPLGYIASDIYARFKRHQGFNVLHPQGYDSFGLPAEQYAIQTGQHPAVTTEANILRYREQLDRIGFSFDWSREVRTSEPDYYKHTQWIFIQLFNSWYNLITNRAESIEDLVTVFAAEGNGTVQAVCDEGISLFSAAQWAAFTADEQEQVLLQYRMTYLAETEVNWCPALGTVLANDEIINGLSERGGHPVVRKKMTQWSMRISAYADRLLEGLDTIDWSDSLKESQRNWIGKSVGASVTFKLKDSTEVIDVFTTRPDTIFGVTFMTLAPEHDLVSKITTTAQQPAVSAYVEATSKRSERERMADVKTISGVFTGAYAEHPFTKEAIPVWIGDYVLAGYGTGAVMAVPAGDERDFAFAKHFDIRIQNIFEGIDLSEGAYGEKQGVVLEHSDFLNGLGYKEATALAIEKLEVLKQGKGKTNFRLRDAVFSRQRYWGEPFPVYYVNGLPKMIDVQYLPILLPEVEKYLPTEEGLPPLGNATVWAWDTVAHQVVENAKIDNKTVFALELNTMPGWAGSSFYWLRYMEANNQDEIASKEAIQYWQNVDLYIGGNEHATGHLLYARFWNKFLKDIGIVAVEEPFKKLINQGMILGNSAFVYRLEGSNTFISKNAISDQKVQALHVDVSLVNASSELDVEGFKAWRPDFASASFVFDDNGKYIVGHEVEKMSKSKFNVVNPDDICEEYGADTLRLYEMFLGPLEQAKPWNTAGISGVFGFLKKLWRLYADDNGIAVIDDEPTTEMYKSLHKTIKKVSEDIENFSFNTSVSQFMICVNELSQQKCHHRAILEPLAVVIAPYAPHIAEELWFILGHHESVSKQAFPDFIASYLIESTKEYPVSFNGKMRFKLELPMDLTAAQIEEIVMKDARTVAQLNGVAPKKVIIVPGKIINLVG